MFASGGAAAGIWTRVWSLGGSSPNHSMLKQARPRPPDRSTQFVLRSVSSVVFFRLCDPPALGFSSGACADIPG